MSNPLRFSPYVPAPVPQDPKYLVQFLRAELVRISDAINSLQSEGSDGEFVPILDTSPTAATAGAATALPGVPVGYLEIMVDGQPRRVPFWNP